MDELALRNSRRITELENRQQVNYSNHSLEAHQLKNEGTTLKAVRGAVVSNAVIRAPNIPENLPEKLSELDESMDGIVETIDTKADKEHTHTIADITDYEPTDISGKADKDHTHTQFEKLTIGSSYFEGATMTMNVVNRKGRIMVGRNGDQARLLIATDQTNGTNGVIIARQSTANFAGTVREAYLLNQQGNTSFPGTLTAANVDANNETRLKAVEEAVATSKYDDTELRELINGKSDNGHTHKIAEITDYEPYDDRDVRFLITKHKNEHSIDCASLQNQITAVVDKQTNELKSGYEIYRLNANSGEAKWTDSDFKYHLIVDPNEENGDITFYVEYANPTVRIEISYDKIVIEHEGYTSEEDGYYHGTIHASDILGKMVTEPRSYLAFYVDGVGHTTTIYIDAEAILGVKPENNDKLITQGMLLDLMYPVGSIYTSMNPMSPAKRFGGTWEQIVDRFLFCASSSRELGGSKKITVQQLPPHNHQYASSFSKNGYPDGWDDTLWDGPNYWYGNRDCVKNMTSSSVGLGEDYMPPYLTVYAWFRIE